MNPEDKQMDISDLGLWFGKMSQESSPQTGGKISESSSKKPPESPTRPPLFLDYRAERFGLLRDVFWETDGLSLGEYTTSSFGVAPSEERESRLSEILEDNPPRKYCLSKRSCLGILRRAEERGKELPELLRKTLIRQSHSSNDSEKTGGVKESSSLPNESEHCQPSTSIPSSTMVYGISPKESNAMRSGNPHSGIYEAETARTLDLQGGNPNCNQGGMMVVQKESKAFSQDAYDKYSPNSVSATIKESGGIYGGGSECLVITTSGGENKPLSKDNR